MKLVEKRIFVISIWLHGFQASDLTLGSDDKNVKYFLIDWVWDVMKLISRLNDKNCISL